MSRIAYCVDSSRFFIKPFHSEQWMEDVPFVFRQSAIGLLGFSDYPNEKPLKPLPSAAWQNAIEAERADRIEVGFSIGPEDGVWSYRIHRRFKVAVVPNDYIDREITFEELRNFNRRNLRICRVVLSSSKVVAFRPPRRQSSLEEITELVMFALPHVNMTHFSVNTKDFPQNDLLKLISLFNSSSIRHLSIKNITKETWAALGVHLESASFKILTVDDEELSDEWKLKFTEFVKHERFEHFSSRCPALLDMELFKYLFNKPQTEPRWSVSLPTSIDMEDLRDFEKPPSSTPPCEYVHKGKAN